MEYGLIGRVLGHSYSKEIHEQIADYQYELKELEPSLRKRVFLLALSEVGMRENVTEKHLRSVDAVLRSQNHKAATAELTGGFRVSRIGRDLVFFKEE